MAYTNTFTADGAGVRFYTEGGRAELLVSVDSGSGTITLKKCKPEASRDTLTNYVAISSAVLSSSDVILINLFEGDYVVEASGTSGASIFVAVSPDTKNDTRIDVSTTTPS